MRWSPIAKMQVALGVVLLATLAGLWLAPDLSLKNMRWQPPPAQLASLQTLLEPVQLPQRALADDSAALLVIQERPLFVLSRRPAPPAPVAEQPVAPEKNSWEKAVLVGVFSGGTNGIIFRREDKDHRLLLNQSFEGWMLQSVEPQRARVVRAGQSVVLELKKVEAAALHRAPPAAAAASRGAGARAAQRGAAEAPPAPPSATPVEQPVFGGTAR